VAAILTVAGCGGKQDNTPPVATPSLTLSKDRIPIGSPVTLTYRFQVAPGATFDKNDWVFVHVLDSEGEQMWTDDHEPPTPTTQWKGGQTVEYSRTVFVPNYPYIGEATIRLGLYDRDTGTRQPLQGEDAGRREYVVAHAQILPSSEGFTMLPKSGWHPAEIDANNPTSEWQWSQKVATWTFANPKKDATLYLEYDARPDQFTPPQQVTLRVGDQTIAQFTADAKDRTLKTFPVTAAQLGGGEQVELTMEVDRTFAPGGGDPRELGIRVFHAYLEPR
jgi:hypothetical protein